jgi:radical SAM superfamily enzyme YgiQ (UPF0313 family)
MTDFKKYQVVFFSGGSQHFNSRPLAIYRLASHLRNHNVTVKTIDFFAQMPDEVFYQAVDMYISDSTVLVGISATILIDHQTGNFFGIDNEQFVKRIDYIKQKNPKIKFVAGGGQFNNLADSLRQKIGLYFDYISIGQGESSILALVNHVLNNTPLITTTVVKPMTITDQTYPFLHFNSSKNTFIDDDDILPQEALPLEIARGCIFKCKFCSYDLINKNSQDFTKTEEQIKAELIYNYKTYQTQYYYIVDDLINDSPEKIDMLERVISSLPFKIYFSGYCRLDLLWRYPNMIDQLKRIGLIGVFFGIETINDKSGKAVGKGLGKKRIEETLRLCASVWQNNVHVEGHFIIGLPHDTKETVEELRNWSLDMLDQQLLHKTRFEPLSINPMLGKADIDQHPEKFGYKILSLSPLSSDVIKTTRYANFEANWETEHYSWTQACNAADLLNAESNSLHPFKILNAFNMGTLLFLTDKIGLGKHLLKIVTKKISTSEKQMNNLLHLTDVEYQKYIQNYFDKLLKENV